MFSLNTYLFKLSTLFITRFKKGKLFKYLMITFSLSGKQAVFYKKGGDYCEALDDIIIL